VLGAEIEPIRAALESLAGVPAILFPQIVLPLEPSEPASVSGEGIEMVCCGPARAEKGSEVLQDAVRIYRRRFPQGRARFTIHWPEDFVGGSGRPVTMDPVLARDPQVTYLKRYLTHEEYETQLQKTQVVLLPYRLSAYRLRGSRVVVEAVVNGIPAIVTRGSALAGVAESHGAALTCEDGSAESLAHAIREMEERYEELKSVAAERAPAAARAFSAHSFRETFLSAGPERVQFPPGPRSATEGDRSC